MLGSTYTPMIWNVSEHRHKTVHGSFEGWRLIIGQSATVNTCKNKVLEGCTATLEPLLYADLRLLFKRSRDEKR